MASSVSTAPLFPEILRAQQLGIDLRRLPRHIAFIMDGNGRWAKKRNLLRSAGHKAGVDALRSTITSAVHLGIEVMSAYAFSTENWGRPPEEVEMLMHLFAKTLIAELPLFEQENVRLRFLGDISPLPSKTREVFYEGLEKTQKNTGMTLCLAVNYGGRAELARAARHLASRCVADEMAPEDITVDILAENLYTKDLPDPELLIRTSGEMRLSNFLLFQLAYAELYVTDTLWPDFNLEELMKALSAYQARDRRFGKV